MPPRKGPPPSPPKDVAPQREGDLPTRGFWSGNLAFGLVSLPVNLVPAQRSARVGLRMLARDGTPLKRRFFSSGRERSLDDADIVRGYEVDKDRFVVITDEELASLTPKLSYEIDLRRFVPLADIDPMYFEQGYYLVPGKGSGKAYRLLAAVMEETARAGIATFVMRGKQYLVAIIARSGILRAATLRFADELRAVTGLGLEKPEKTDAQEVNKFEKAIGELTSDTFDPLELESRQTERLLTLIEQKRGAGTDVIAASAVSVDEDSGTNVVDLMQYLKESLGGHTRSGQRGRSPTNKQESGKPERKAPKPARSPKKTPDKSAREASKAELYERAKSLGVQGRSQMTRDELIDAIEKASE